MKLLLFQVRKFSWASHSQTIEDADPGPVEACVEDAVVVFVHAQKPDEEDRDRCFRKALKNIKWLANKRSFRTVVLHSFTHLGGESADSIWARQFLSDLAERLQNTDYEVQCTPFGWFCSWNLDVYGESLAKVFKEF